MRCHYSPKRVLLLTKGWSTLHRCGSFRIHRQANGVNSVQLKSCITDPWQPCDTRNCHLQDHRCLSVVIAVWKFWKLGTLAFMHRNTVFFFVSNVQILNSRSQQELLLIHVLKPDICLIHGNYHAFVTFAKVCFTN